MTDDFYLPLIRQQWANIARLYNEHADARPLMMLDVEAGEIHAFAAEKLLQSLDGISRQTVRTQYERALANRQMVLFVRDAARKQLLSYTLKLEDEPPTSLEGLQA